jgi:hypothetical protein
MPEEYRPPDRCVESSRESGERKLQRMAFRDRPPHPRPPNMEEERDRDKWERIRPKADEKQEIAVQVARAMLKYEPVRGDGYKFVKAAEEAGKRDFEVRERRQRRRDQRIEYLEDLPPSHKALEVEDQSKRTLSCIAVQEMLSILPDIDSTYVFMHFFRGMNINEIARAFVVPARTVLDSVERSLARIREVFPRTAFFESRVQSRITCTSSKWQRSFASQGFLKHQE